MIYDSAENVKKHSTPDGVLYRAVRFVLDFDRSLPDGRYEIDGDDAFALVQTVTTRPASEKRFEAHRSYTDVQMVLEGRERHDVALFGAEDLQVVNDYDSGKDVIFFAEPPHFSTLIMKPGMFAVYCPQDAHRPCCCIDAPQTIRKVCVKVRVR